MSLAKIAVADRSRPVATALPDRGHPSETADGSRAFLSAREEHADTPDTESGGIPTSSDQGARSWTLEQEPSQARA
jgi:hypothetical protein